MRRDKAETVRELRMVQTLLQMGGWTSVDRITAHEHGLLYEARQTMQPIETSLQRVQKQKIEPPCWNRNGPRKHITPVV